MNLSSLRLPLFLAALSLVSVAGSLTACSDDDSGSPAGAAGTTGTTGGNVTNGAAVATKFACKGCHGADFGGDQYYPNITNDADTGLGKWTDEQIKTAIRGGKDDEGKELCSEMLRYKDSQINDSDMADLIAYLRSLNVKRAITEECSQ